MLFSGKACERASLDFNLVPGDGRTCGLQPCTLDGEVHDQIDGEHKVIPCSRHCGKWKPDAELEATALQR